MHAPLRMLALGGTKSFCRETVTLEEGRVERVSWNFLYGNGNAFYSYYFASHMVNYSTDAMASKCIGGA